MDSFQFDELLEMSAGNASRTRAKPVKRKWREIEAMNDRRSLLKELREMDCCADYHLADIKL
ncbi:DUF3545 family protein [Vibrio sp. SM6]|uniref:DUF3545 family protein n=1 Tax=Vibrio agarilyticus TaxID=2726741 RepID=A0A7X8TP03_9VIBR|nr:DUF3545 family protein [Vibrio agarilyticus]NLS12261.1 DUF3545 family protein [Vibrio agarilyticus]